MQALPTFLVIGAMKCGTTSLHHYLNLHPEIYMSRTKELNYFTARRNLRRGLGWYQSNFDARFPQRGETSPAYTRYPQHRGVPRRIHDLLPGIRLIYLMRDPVERAYSHYLHQVALGREQRPPGEALRERKYLSAGQYHTQLQRYLAYFKREQLLLIFSEDLQRDRMSVLQQVFRFLGVDEGFSSPDFDQVWHQTEHKRQLTVLGGMIHTRLRAVLNRLPWNGKWIVLRPVSTPLERSVLPEDVRQWLQDSYRDEILGLQQLSGRDLSSWLAPAAGTPQNPAREVDHAG